MKNSIPKQSTPQKNSVKNNTIVPTNPQYCCFNFRFLKTYCVSLKEFNNHFKDQNHFEQVISSLIGVVLPTISNLTTTQLMSGGRFSQQFHFHKVENDKYEKVKAVLESYSFSKTQIDQILDGGNIYQFVGNLDGKVESRIVCEYINGVLSILFFDTNHHLYFNKSKAGESTSFSFCPFEAKNECGYAFNCFAKQFLDIEKVAESYGFSYG